MGTVQALHRVNGEKIHCANCGAELGDDRAAANTAGGVKFFCRQLAGDNPNDSCFLDWQKLHVRRPQ
jgi:hypothetical protein